MTTDRLVLIGLLTLLHVDSGYSSVLLNGWSGSSSMSENYDSSITLDGFSASCHLTWEVCLNVFGINLFCSNESETKACTCTISSNPASGLFYLSGSTSQWYLNKYSCNATTCGNYPSGSTCSTSNGCASAGTYNIGVTCSESNSNTSTSSTQTHTVTFSAEAPSFSITNLDATLSASRTQGSSTVIFSTTTTAGLTVYQWVESSSVSNSWVLDTGRLFRLNTGNGQIYINSDPSYEYSWTYSMTVCSYSRRQGDCGTLTIQFSGCYQRPYCNDKSDTIADTHAIGGTLFTMTVPDPVDHFSTTSFISSSFVGLTYTIESTDLSVASVGYSTGIVASTGNITVFPSYPNKVYTMVIRVANSESCSYTSTCAMTLTVTFTNWPIRITNMESVTTNLHEDTTAETTLHTIATSDANSEDRATCVLDGANSVPANNGKFVVRETQTDSAVYVILNKENPGFDYGTTSSYTVAVTCSDLYGSSASASMTVTIYGCDDGRYGNNCSETCGKCRDGQTCDSLTGHCVECDDGFKYSDTFCKTACDPYTYGYNCTERCGNCRNNASCDPVNGHCAGCEDGYRTTDSRCKTACPIGTFGGNCRNDCGMCEYGNVCDRRSGTCPNGCSGSYLGDQCLQMAGQTEESDTKISIPVYIGSILGSILVTFTVMFSIMMWKRRHRTQSNNRNNEPNTNQELSLQASFQDASQTPSIFDNYQMEHSDSESSGYINVL